MKNNTLYRILVAVCLMLPLVSCVREEKDIFDKSASERMNEWLVSTQNVLTSAANGWVMHYYPEGNQIYGGYIYTLVFTEDGEVTVRSELFDDPYTSLYKMDNDDGPVLSFDTNNYAFHYFATPSGGASMPNQYGESGKYQAYKGDFEFMVVKAEADEVILRGKRTSNLIHMYPLDEDPATYMSKVIALEDILLVTSFEGTIGGDEATLYLNPGNRQATVTLTGEKYLDDEGESPSETVAFLYTESGIRFYKPVEIGPYTLEILEFEPTEKKLISSEADLVGSLPEGWHFYNDFVGSYTLTYNDGDATMTGIEIVADVKNKSYKIKGMNPLFDVVATYDQGMGQIEVQAQYVAEPDVTENTYRVMMAAWDSDKGYVNYTTGGLYGMLNEEGNTNTWSNNKKFSGYVVDGFLLYYFTTTGTRVGSTSDPWIWSGRESLASGKNQLWGWTTFTRN